MRVFGHVEITTVDLPDELQFRMVREYGVFNVIFQAALTIYVLWWVWKWQADSVMGLVPSLFAVIIILGLLANWFHGRTTTLRVTSRELVATGNLNRMLTTEVRVAAYEMEAIGYHMGGEDEPSGLCTKRGWKHTCLLPGVSRKQARMITDAISLKFPQTYYVDHGLLSDLLGK
jgi:hypothetical protein